VGARGEKKNQYQALSALILNERARDILCIGASVGFTAGGIDEGKDPCCDYNPA
jgi:hypothetical protein